MKTYYITDCSCASTSPDGTMFCEHTIDTILEKNLKDESGKIKKLYICPNHGGFIVKRKIFCQDCGCEVYLRKTGRKSIRCKKCQKKINRKKNVLANRRYRNSNQSSRPKKSSKADPDMWDCENRDACLTKYSKPERCEAIPCRGCEMYKPGSVNYDPYLATGPGYSRVVDYMTW